MRSCAEGATTLRFWAGACGDRNQSLRSWTAGYQALPDGSGGGPMSLREALVGMIGEYARHIGHADLLRERIDGRIGQ